MVFPGSSSVTVCRRGPLSHAGRDADRTVVSLRGEHDLATVAALSESLTRAMAFDDSDLVVDLSGVQFMGAATVGVIIHARQFLRARSRSLVLRSPSRCAWRVLDVCGLGELVDQRPLDAGTSCGASALGTWVEVPATDRAELPADPPAPARAEGGGPTTELVDGRSP